MLFATAEFSRWVAADVHNQNKLTMGNGVLHFWPWGADLFDVMGVEVDWLSDGNQFQPYSRRAIELLPHDVLSTTLQLAHERQFRSL